MASDFPVVYVRRPRQLSLSKLAQLPEAEWREILDAEDQIARDWLGSEEYHARRQGEKRIERIEVLRAELNRGHHES